MRTLAFRDRLQIDGGGDATLYTHIETCHGERYTYSLVDPMVRYELKFAATKCKYSPDIMEWQWVAAEVVHKVYVEQARITYNGKTMYSTRLVTTSGHTIDEWDFIWAPKHVLYQYSYEILACNKPMPDPRQLQRHQQASEHVRRR